MADNDGIPGFGWVAKLMRWSQNDRTVSGQDGPLPPPRARSLDKPDDPIGYADPGGMLGMIGGNLHQFFTEPKSRVDLYRIYDEMDKTDLAGSVLDLYAEDATQMDPDTGRTVWVRSKDKGMVQAATEMMQRVRLEDEVTALARDVAKHGDDFERLVYRSGSDGGVMRMLGTHPSEMIRKENKEGKLEGYSQTNRKFRAGKSPISYAWDYAHFRLRGHDRRFAYGTGILKNAIRPWRQLSILEDWMVQYTISRHPDRNAFMLDVGSSADVDAADIARRFRQKLKRHMIVDPAGTSGRNMDYNFNPITPTEDMVVALRANSQTRIDKISGSGNAADIAPLDYCMGKFFAAVRAPREFFGLGSMRGGQDGGVTMKASLCTQDIRYARGCARIQRSIRQGIQYLLEFNYMLLSGADPEDVTYDFTDKAKAFSVHMGPISFLAELERLEVMQIRQQVGVALADMGRDNPAYKASEWTKYILRDIIRIPPTELERILRDSDEVIAAQQAILNAKPVDVHTAMPAGVGAQTKMSQQQFGLQKDQFDHEQDQADHQQTMDKAQLKLQRDAARSDQQAQESALLTTDAAKAAMDAAADARARGLQSGGELNRDDLRLLSEVLAKSPALRRTIELGALMWRDDDLPDTDGRALPDRKAEVYRHAGDGNPVSDSLTVEDLREIAGESIYEGGV